MHEQETAVEKRSGLILNGPKWRVGSSGMKAQPLTGSSATDPIERGRDTELEVWVLLGADWSEVR